MGQFQLNWPVIVAEAKQRRKSQNLSQQRLAALANISTPTISRFESGSKDIELSSIFNILKILGMIDQRYLVFPDPLNVQYDHNRMIVIFWGQDETKSIQCAISLETLKVHYQSKSRNPIKIYLEHHSAIEHEAVKKYLNNQFESDDYIFIKKEDL